jgi:hypothetical protein
MAVQRKNKAKKGNFFGFNIGKIKLFLKNNWVIITIVLFGLPYAYRYYKTQFQLNDEQDLKLEKDKAWLANLSPTTQKSRADKITTSIELQAVAKKLASDLGTAYSDKNSYFSWLNPKGWTENDESVLNTLLKYRNFFPTLERLYFECYSNSRNLRTDILELLDEKELIRLRQAINI